MCLEFSDSFAVTRRGKGNDADAAPIVWPAPDPAQPPLNDQHRSTATRALLDISSTFRFVHDTGQGAAFPLYPAIP